MNELHGRRALVGGGSQGIGRACAEALARGGASVTLLARDREALAAVCGGLPRSAGQTHAWLSVDFRDPDGLKRSVAEHLAQSGPIEILINNTGGPAAGPLAAAQPTAFGDALQMHIVCSQLLVQTLLPGMQARGYGRIINIISTSVRQPIPGLGVSNTIRAAVAGWAKTLAGELGPLGITVNNVLPGYTDTARLRSLIQARASGGGQTAEQVEQRMKADIPLGRFGRPEEIAAAVVFLASPAAAYISGVSLPVDGGRISAI